MLLIDEAYVDFAEGNGASVAAQRDNVIVLRSLSKGYSLAGLRLGYAIAGKNLIAGLLKVKDSYNVDAVAIALATAAIKDQDYFTANVQKVKRNRQMLTAGLRALGFGVGDSCANFVLAQTNGGSARAIYEQLAQRNIYVRFFDMAGLSDKLRISVGTAAENEKLLVALGEILSR